MKTKTLLLLFLTACSTSDPVVEKPEVSYAPWTEEFGKKYKCDYATSVMSACLNSHLKKWGEGYTWYGDERKAWSRYEYYQDDTCVAGMLAVKFASEKPASADVWYTAVGEWDHGVIYEYNVLQAHLAGDRDSILRANSNWFCVLYGK